MINKAVLDRINAKPTPGLNKEALAEVYLKASKPWKAILVLEDERPTYRPNSQREEALLSKIKADFPNWEDMEVKDAKLNRSFLRRVLDRIGL